MLSPDYIKSAPAFIVQQFWLLEDEVIREVSDRVGKTGNLSTTSLYQLNLMHDISESTERVNKIIDDGFKAIGKTTEELIAGSARFTYANDIERFQAYSSNILPSFKNNAFIQNITDGIRMQTTDELAKLSKTKGFLIGGKFIKADDLLGNLTNQAIFQTSSGLFTYEDTARRLIKQLGDSGIRTIDYESGRSYEMESQIRRIIVDGVRQLSNNIGLRNANDLGTDLMEISAHSNARPTHASWQGNIVSLSGKGTYLTTSDIGYGDVSGFGGANCRHSWSPYFEGSTMMHTPEDLKAYADETVTLNGKEMSSYDASQVLRRYERAIRASQRRLEGFKALGDPQGYELERARLRRLTSAYKDTTLQTGIKGDPRFLKIYKSDGKTSKLNYVPKPSKPLSTTSFETMSKEKYSNLSSERSTYEALLESYGRKYGYDLSPFADDVFDEASKMWVYEMRKEAVEDWRRLMGKGDTFGYVQKADGSKLINAYLRNDKDKNVIDAFIGPNVKGKKRAALLEEWTKDVEGTIDAMNRLMKLTEIESDIVVTRWAGADSLSRLGINVPNVKPSRIGHAFVTDGLDLEDIQKQIAGKLIGATIEDKGFTSASVVKDLNVFTGSDVLYTIKVPKGTNAIITKNVSESEIIFAPGMKTVIEDVKITNSEAIDWEDNKVKRKSVEIILRILS